MKRVAIWAVLLFLFPIQGGKSQQSRQESERLKDLQRVAIVIEKLNPNGKALGLSKSQLESQVLVGLKRNIPRLTIGKNAKSYIYVKVNLIRDTTTGGRDLGYSACVEVRLIRPVVIFTDDYQTSIGGATLAIVWNKGIILGGPSSQATEVVSRVLDNLLTSFAADYYRQNP